jgi:OOP family OmpA-OmpF porin
MKRIMLGCAAVLLSLAAAAQEESTMTEGDGASPAPSVESSGNAWTALQDRYYVTPSLSWVFTDSGRQTDDGQALSFAAGKRWGEIFALEGFAQYNRFDHEQGSGTADLFGLGVNSLIFPTPKTPAYLLLGAGYGDVGSHPGGHESYGALLLNVGGGYWWKPFDLFFKGVSLRTEATYRLDAHNDRRTGTTVANGRKDFGDILLSIGFNIPIGEVAAPPPPPPEEPVEVVPVATASDSDGDGVGDELDQCPETPAGTAVDAKGCPVVAASACKAPGPGEKLDLAGCGTGDVIVLKGVNFEFNKDRLTPNAKVILDGVGEALQAAPATNVELGGHTDGKGTDDYNQGLSQRRACSVGRYLGERGVGEERMTPVGYGESKPVADNETDEGREQNRRVELKILDGAGSGLGSCSATRAANAVADVASEPRPAEAAPAEETAPSASDSANAVSASETETVPPPAAPAAPEPAAAAMPAAGSAESMQLVPEGEVFETPSSPAGTESADSKSGAPPSSSATQMVPESEVFGAGN